MAVTAQQIKAYLQKKGSPLVPYAADFVRVGNKYGIDPRFLVAISGIETSFGKAGSGLRNPFGWNSARKYSGPREVLELIGAGLAKRGGYYDGKNNIRAIGATWAPPGADNDAGGNSGWPAAVAQFYREQGGNPGAAVKGLARGATPATVPAPGGGGSTGTAGAVPGVIAGGSGLDIPKLMALMQQRRGAILGREGGGYTREGLGAQFRELALSAVPQIGGGHVPAEAVRAPGAPGGASPTDFMGNQVKFTKSGAPNSGTHTIGNWQSDMAYDFMGKSGAKVLVPKNAKVVKISGQRGGDPRFAGYGVTLALPGGQAFFKHLGSLGPRVRVGATLPAGSLVGTLDPSVQGGPHLHLGAQSRGFLDQLARYYS